MSPDSSPDPVADRASVVALARKQGRAFAMYYVLLGVASFVLGMLLALLPFGIGVALGLAIFLACMVGLGVFINTHRSTARAFMKLARLFWVMWGVTMILTIVGVGLWDDHAWLGWLGGVLGLLQGLAVGHLIDREAARRASDASEGGIN